MKKTLILNFFAFANNTWKLDDNGAIVMKDGNPVYVDGQGREISVATDTISKLGNEAKMHREAKELLENKLKLFEGIDPETARKSIETVSKLDAKQLIDAGKVDEVKKQITDQMGAQIAEKDKALLEATARYENLLIDNAFAQSEFVRSNIAVPRDMFEATFRKNFKVENGKITAYDNAGNSLMSPERNYEPANTEEALKILVNSHPQKNVILKADVGSGSGSTGAGGGSGITKRVMKRSEIEGLPPMQQAQYAAKVRSGEIQLTD